MIWYSSTSKAIAKGHLVPCMKATSISLADQAVASSSNLVMHRLSPLHVMKFKFIGLFGLGARSGAGCAGQALATASKGPSVGDLALFSPAIG